MGEIRNKKYPIGFMVAFHKGNPPFPDKLTYYKKNGNGYIALDIYKRSNAPIIMRTDSGQAMIINRKEAATFLRKYR